MPRPVLFTRTCPVCNSGFPVTSRDPDKRHCSALCLYAPPKHTDPSKDEVDGGCRLVPLSQNQFAKVDPSRYEWAMRWKWTAWWSPHSQSFYAVRNEYVAGDRKHPKRIIMARAIVNCPNEKTVDHVDHDTLNNCGINLRVATYSQQNCNLRKRRNTRSSFKGLGLIPQTGRWRARIQVDGKVRHIGVYSTESQAHDAYQSEAMIMHGDFRCVIIGTVPERATRLANNRKSSGSADPIIGEKSAPNE